MTSSPLPRVSIVIPCRDEARHIAACIESIRATTYPRDRLEVLVVDGRSTDGTRDIVARYAAAYPWIRLLDNPDGITPAALNIGIRAAAGEVIMRMDAHVEYPPRYIHRLVTAQIETGAANVGTLIETQPADDSPTARAIAIALSHPFGVGNSYFRTGTDRPRWVDSVAFGCFRRELFTRIGLFDEDLVRNQDDEFNYRIQKYGGRVLLIPDVVARYYARRSLGRLARMFYQYGYFKPLVARKIGRVMTLRQLVPPAFVLSLLLAALLGLWWRPAWMLGAGVLGLYGTLVAGCAVPVGWREGARAALALTAALPALHCGYGIGFLHGVVRHILRPRTRAPGRVAVSLTR